MMKPKTRLIFCLLCLLTAIQCTPPAPGERILNVHIKGIKYDSLFASLDCPSLPDRYRITGQPSDTTFQNWTFAIPDSVFQIYAAIDFAGKIASGDSSGNFLFVPAVKNGSTEQRTNASLYLGNAEKFDLTFQYQYRYVTGYVSAHLVELLDPTEEQFLSIVIGKEILDHFKNLNVLIGSYCDSIVKHPASKVLTIQFSRHFLRKTSEIKDLEKVYCLFSEENRQSPFGEKIKEYIERRKNFIRFDNISLNECTSGQPEPILIDTTRTTLVVFSASWCGPCHELLPTLKQIDRDLNRKLEIVYISLDEKATLENWKDWMKKEQIPWRSLLPAERSDEIQKKYFIEYIPYSYLVHPNGSFEPIELQDKNELKKLYEIKDSSK